MKSQVYQEIAAINRDLQAHRNHLMEGEFVNEKAKVENVLNIELKQVKDDINIIKQKIATVQRYQVLFHMEPYTFTQLPETIKVFLI